MKIQTNVGEITLDLNEELTKLHEKLRYEYDSYYEDELSDRIYDLLLTHVPKMMRSIQRDLVESFDNPME